MPKKGGSKDTIQQEQEADEGEVLEVYETMQQEFADHNKEEDNCFKDLYDCLNGLLD